MPHIIKLTDRSSLDTVDAIPRGGNISLTEEQRNSMVRLHLARVLVLLLWLGRVT